MTGRHQAAGGGPVAQRLRLLRLLPRGGRLAVVFRCLMHVIQAANPPLTALAAGELLVVVARPTATTRLVTIVAVLSGLMLTAQAASLIGETLDRMLSQRIDGYLRHRIRTIAGQQHRIATLESEPFQDDAVRASESGTAPTAGRVRSAGTAATGQLEVMFRFGTSLTSAGLVAAVSVPLAIALFVISVVVRVMLRRQWSRVTFMLTARAAQQRRVRYWSELATGAAAKEVRLFGLSRWIGGRYRAAAFAANAAAWRELWRVLRRQWWSAVLVALSAAAALGVPAAYALVGRITPHQMVTGVLAGFSVFVITRVGPEAFDLDHGITSVDALGRLAARFEPRATATPRPAGPQAPRRPSGSPVVRFENVVFRYPGERRPILNGLCLTLHSGQTVAVVGENGAGKTTLVKLLAGLYQPTAGRITVDGVSLARLDPVWWRERIVAVFQDFVQYPASVADNVALAAPEAAGDRYLIAEAIRLSGDSDLLAGLSSGLDTSLWKEGTGGTDLSGGQWQRIALARAIFASAAGRPVVILDEPTAHLDARAEAAFHSRVMRVLTNTTTVLISHRLSTVRSAERIVMLRDGRVGEAGTHDELLALGGGYARFFDLQAAAYLKGAA